MTLNLSQQKVASSQRQQARCRVAEAEPQFYGSPADDELAKLGRDLRAIEREQDMAAAHETNVDQFVKTPAIVPPPSSPAAANDETRARPAAQKKGQFEFVDFVEPPHAKVSVMN